MLKSPLMILITNRYIDRIRKIKKPETFYLAVLLDTGLGAVFLIKIIMFLVLGMKLTLL